MSSISVFRNCDTDISFTFPSGTDLNGDTIYFTVKSAVGGEEDDSDALIGSDVTVSTSTNVATITLTNSDTDVSAGTYRADIKRVSSGGTIYGYDSFTFVVLETVTQRSS